MKSLVAITISILLFCSDAKAKELKFIKVTNNLNHPWGMSFIDQNNLLITERGGRLLRVHLPSQKIFPVSHDLKILALRQGGLLDVLYHKEYVYLSYSEDRGSGKSSTSVVRGKIINDVLMNTKTLFRAEPPINSGFHFGSRLVIQDSFLFISAGERHEGMIAQDGSKHPGSIIRINLDGSTPSTNPHFVNKKDWSPEVYQIGVRNPQGMALSPFDHKVYMVNHGAKGGDFLGKVEFGENYGWEEIGWGGTNYSGSEIGSGKASDPRFMEPMRIWIPSIAPSGMAFYQGETFKEWEGDVLVGSLKFDMLIKVDMEGSSAVGETVIFRDRIGRVRDLEIDHKGDIYLLADESDTFLWKLTR
jgi:quinoprotein glucose dehydrogenase|tara:strand:- start:265 stop:1344 length:1080 start_codon:yes stop_codon:yes gene_type:complete